MPNIFRYAATIKRMCGVTLSVMTLATAFPYISFAAIDITAPQVTAFAVVAPAPAYIKSQTIPVKAFTATDNTGGSGIGGYLVTETSDIPATDNPSWQPTKPATYVTTSTGAVTLYPWVKDKAGNVSALASGVQVIIDITKPIVDSFDVTTPINTRTVSILFFTAADPVDGFGNPGSGVTGYLITATPTTPSATAKGWRSQAQTSYTLSSSSGTKTLYAWAKDGAGNISLSQSASVVIDRTKPVVSAFTAAASVNSTTVPIQTFTASDAGSGVAAYQITESNVAPLAGDGGWNAVAPDTYIVSGPWAGKKYLYAWAKDTVGNVSKPKKVSVLFDQTVPYITAFSVAVPAPASVNSQTIPITTFTAADNVGGSGIGGYLVTETSDIPLASDPNWQTTKPATYVAVHTGAVTLYPWVKDRAGNVSTLGTGANVKIDITVPTVDNFAVTTPVNTLTVPITSFTASDPADGFGNPGSGVAGYLVTTTSTTPLATATGWSSTPQASYTASSAGTITLYAWAKDGAGNVSSAASASVLIDQVKPVVTGFSVSTPVSGTTVTILTLTATDTGGTGVAAYMVTESSVAPLADDGRWSAVAPDNYVVSGPWSGAKSLYAWAKDNVGNVSLPRIATTVATGGNIVPITVNGALCSDATSASYPNKPCVSVTVCAPGTSDCQTITDILLDTGSTGLRLFKQALSNATVSNGLLQVYNGPNALAECVQFADGSADWGPVKTADVVLGNEPAVQVPVQIIDYTFGPPPAACTNPEQTPSSSGLNGILGVGLWLQDCGATCRDSSSNGQYFVCSGSGCSQSSAELSSQVQNPVAMLPDDNNGVILKLPTVPLGGLPSVDGSLVLGIGTQSNNTPGNVTAYATDLNGEFTTKFNGKTYYSSFIDSGSNALYFKGPSSLPDCSSSYAGWFCPASTTSLSAVNVGASGYPSGTVPFQIGNFRSLYNSSSNVFVEIGGSYSGGFDWGLPFFLGRDVYVGFEGRSSSLGVDTYWAY